MIKENKLLKDLDTMEKAIMAIPHPRMQEGAMFVIDNIRKAVKMNAYEEK